MDHGKQIIWMGRSREDLRDFPREAKEDLGYALRRLQNGEVPAHFKPMPGVGSGAYELTCRTGTQSVDHRVFYVVKFAEALYVLHAFEKTTRKTPKSDIQMGSDRYAEMLELRKQLKL